MAKKLRILFPYVEAGIGHIMPMKAFVNEFSKKFFKQVNFCPFTHAVSEGANVYFQFEIITPLKIEP